MKPQKYLNLIQPELEYSKRHITEILQLCVRTQRIGPCEGSAHHNAQLLAFFLHL